MCRITAIGERLTEGTCMMQNQQSQIRTDLAIESAESFSESEHTLSGVVVREITDENAHVHITHVHIKNAQGARRLGKPMGRYITLETPYLSDEDEDYHKEITKVLMEQLDLLIPDIHRKKILVVGIGNREITPDALGPMVVDHLFITRHLIREYGSDSDMTRGFGIVSAIAPGVMAQTGMEGREVIRGVIRETKPDVAIIVDALAARSVRRLNSTIQLTDTGIHPGAGVGNLRHGLDRETLGIPVVAIGIPTVIDAATIVNDTMKSLMDVMEQHGLYQEVCDSVRTFDDQEKYLLMRELMAPEIANMFVTPKDIDETIRRISYTISEAINAICHRV